MLLGPLVPYYKRLMTRFQPAKDISYPNSSDLVGPTNNRLQNVRKRLPHLFAELPRVLPFPLLSGDLFAATATHVFHPGIPHLMLVQPNLSQNRVIFTEPRYLRNRPAFEFFCEVLSQDPSPENATIIVHNGDLSLPPEVLDLMSVTFRSIYAVNLPTTWAQRKNVHPLPIGLENYPWRGETYYRFFQALLQHPNLIPPSPERAKLFHSSFSIRTNPVERGSLMEVLTQHRISNERSSWRKFSEALVAHKFMFSPAGNGLDCHRTWEAIYAGCVPILKRGTLVSSLSESLPIWEVDDWDEPFSLTLVELQEKAESLLARRSELVAAPFWIQRIWS